MGITVVTHTDPSWQRDISMCLKTVKSALPPDGRHLVIECSSHDEWLRSRLDAMKLDDFVVFVDDDDYITKTSLVRCMTALKETGVGIAFTHEIKMYPDGKKVRNVLATNYAKMLVSPEAVHHMVVYRSECVSQRSEDLTLLAGHGVEWIMKCDAAFGYGAIAVPVDGYYWVQHDSQAHNTSGIRLAHRIAAGIIKDEMPKWLTDDAPIHQHLYVGPG